MQQLKAVFKKYSNATIRWVQEEPSNMGPWQYILSYFPEMNIELISRKSSASPATGFKNVHEIEQLGIVERAFK